MKALKRPLTGRRRTVAAVLATTVLLGGTGAATAVAVADDGDHHRNHATTGTGHEDRDDHDGTHDAADDDSAPAAHTKSDIKQAADAAAKSVTGTVTSVELEGHQGKAAWKVDIVDSKGTEHEVTVNAADGKVTGSKADQDDDHDAIAAKSAKTELAQAVNTALGKVPGTATSAELDDHNGRAAWHVDVTDTKGTEHEVTVDAQSGKVTAAQTGDDHDHASGHGTNDDQDDD
ncbi:PepSY domain-containing protein [Streptomyces sp. NPDC101209]|uniref:PepSY domain-containing protein n=1 Tax=Streptomyces sp. NPDC101209 TaxID=3366129 RepID=UPI00380F82EC